MKLNLTVSRAVLVHDLLVALVAFAGTFSASLAAHNSIDITVLEAAAVAGGVAGVKTLARILLPGTTAK